MPAARLTTLAMIACATAFVAASPASARRHPRAKPAAGPLRAGAYVCEGDGAGMFPLTILPGSHYRAAGPAGSYAVAGTTLRFTGGSLANNIGKLEGISEFSLATVGARTAYTHCSLAAAKARG